jgi:hypothetical protein
VSVLETLCYRDQVAWWSHHLLLCSELSLTVSEGPSVLSSGLWMVNKPRPYCGSEGPAVLTVQNLLQSAIS